jgi:hypothetical protein
VNDIIMKLSVLQIHCRGREKYSAVQRRENPFEPLLHAGLS